MTKERSSPLPIDFSSYGIFWGESVHSPSFAMDWRQDPYDKLLYLLNGKSTIHFKNRPPVHATQGTVLLIPHSTSHRLQDSTHSTLLLLCLERKWMKSHPEIQSLWTKIQNEKGFLIHPQLSTLKKIERLWRKCLFEQRSIAPAVPESLQAGILLLLIDLLREKTDPPPVLSRDRILEFWNDVQKNYYEPWDIQTAADACQLSSRQFSSLFKKHQGSTFVKALTRLRIQEFKKLLHHGNPSISATAFACGFEDLSHFYRVFKQETGKSPGKWIKINLLKVREATDAPL